MDSEKKYRYTIRQILNIIVDILIVFCLFKMVTGITTGTEQIYETQRSMFLWQGVMYFSFALLLCAKVNYKNGWLWVIYITYTVIEYYFLIKTGYRENSPTLWAWYTRLWNSVGIMGIIFVNSIFEKGVRQIQKMDLPRMFLLWVSSIGMMTVKGFRLNDTVILSIVLIISLIEFNINSVRKLLYCFFIAYYIAFVRMLADSLIKVPYAGEERYYGTFTNNGLFGAFAGGAVACCIIWWCLACWKKGMIRKVGMIVSALLMIPALYVVGIISARVAMLGIVLTFFITLLVCAISNGKKRFVFGIVIAGVVSSFAFFTAMIVWYNSTSREALDIIKESHLAVGSTLLFWYDRIGRFYDLNAWSGVLPKGSLWAGVDFFSGYRITYFVEYFRRLNLLGHLQLMEWIDYDGEIVMFSHPHNTYLSFPYLYGTVFGGSFLFMMICSYIRNICMVIGEKVNVHRDALLMSFVWLTYCFGIYLNEDFMLNYLPTFIFLIMQSLLLVEKRFRKQN